MLTGDDPVCAVNGPPGTGKTTLLREFYAAVVTDRARVMVGFDDPRSAFGPAQTVPLTQGGTRRFHRVDERLTGFEVVVASSNNAAVANISQEVPGLGEIAGVWQDRVSYFRDATAPDPSSGRGRPGLLTDDAPAWGLAAATLGRRLLGVRFGSVVGRYLKADDPGEHLLAALRRGGSLEDWPAARDRLRTALAAVDAHLAGLERARDEVGAARADADSATARWSNARDAITATAELSAAARRDVPAAEDRARLAAEAVVRLRAARPGFWARLGKSVAARDAEAAFQRAVADSTVAEDRLRSLVDAAAEAHTAHVRLEAEVLAAGTARDDAERRLRETSAGLGPAAVDEGWWSRSRDAQETGQAWVDDELHALQAEVFGAAMNVHEQFARRAGQQVATNLRAWMHLQSGEVRQPDASQLATDVWRSFFLLVPWCRRPSPRWPACSPVSRPAPSGGWSSTRPARRRPPRPSAVSTAAAGPWSSVTRSSSNPSSLCPTSSSTASWPTTPLHRSCLPPEARCSGPPTRSRVAAQRDPAAGWGRPSSCTTAASTRCSPSRTRWLTTARWSPDASPIPRKESPQWARVAGSTCPIRWSALLGSRRRRRRSGPRLTPHWGRRGPRRGHQPVPRCGRRPQGHGRGTHERGARNRAHVPGPGAVAGPHRPRRSFRRFAAVGGGTPNLLNVAVTRARDRLIVVGDWRQWHDVGCAADLARHLPRTSE